MIAVHVADPGILLIEVIGLTDGRVQEHVNGHLVEVIQLVVILMNSGCLGTPSADLLFQLPEKGPPTGNPFLFSVELELELQVVVASNAAVGSPGGCPDENRIVVVAEPAPIIAGHQPPIVIHRVRHPDGPGRTRPGLLET